MGFLDRTLDLVFPPRCTGCGAVGSWICGSCLSSAPRIPDPVCPKCGHPQREPSLCAVCRSITFDFNRARAVYHYEGAIRAAVHKFKYRNLTALAEPLSGLLLEYLPGSSFQPDAVAAVPLHRKRQQERGYNQSELLARRVAACSNLPYLDGVVVRSRFTHPQVGLGAEERHANVSAAFDPGKNHVPGGRVLLIDDVYTTGATLSDCARALKAAGAKSVYCLALARGN
jgi:competence protein ComFC